MAGAAIFSAERLRRRLVDVDEAHLGALRGEVLDDRGADARAAARDEHGATLQAGIGGECRHGSLTGWKRGKTTSPASVAARRERRSATLPLTWLTGSTQKYGRLARDVDHEHGGTAAVACSSSRRPTPRPGDRRRVRPSRRSNCRDATLRPCATGGSPIPAGTAMRSIGSTSASPQPHGRRAAGELGVGVAHEERMQPECRPAPPGSSRFSIAIRTVSRSSSRRNDCRAR